MEFLSLETLQELLQSWGYVVIFTGMLLENAGLPIPGETMTLLGGYSAGSGQLQVWGVLLAACGGAILGDNLGYWIGRRAGWPLILRVGRALGQSPAQMEQLRDRFQRHAGKSVLLGRFVALLRVVAGPMAGAVRMPYRRFLIFNAAGAILWAGTMVSLAWLGGRWIPLATMVKGVVQFGIGALVVLALVLLIPRLLARLETRLDPPDLEEAPAPAPGQPAP
jgi:membrane protein DedA with SNARE-associated domain